MLALTNWRIKYLLLAALCISVGGFFWIQTGAPVGQVSITEVDHYALGSHHFNDQVAIEGVYDLERAKSHFLQALQQEPDHPLVRHQLARIFFIQGEFEDARFYITKQLELFGATIPNSYYVHGLINGYDASRRSIPETAASFWREAQWGFEQFLLRKPTSPWARVDLSWVLFAQGEYVAMLPVLETGLRYTPDNPWLHNMYGLALLNTNRPNQALEHFTLARDQVSVLKPADWGRAYAGNNPADWAQGLAEFRQAVEKNLALAIARVDKGASTVTN